MFLGAVTILLHYTKNILKKYMSYIQLILDGESNVNHSISDKLYRYALINPLSIDCHRGKPIHAVFDPIFEAFQIQAIHEESCH